MGTGSGPGLEKIEATLKTKFKITKKVNPTEITGVQVERNRARKWLKLYQGGFAERVLAKNNMTDCKVADTPMDPGTAKALMLLPTEDSNPR